MNTNGFHTDDRELQAERDVLNIVVLVEEQFTGRSTPDDTRALHRDVEALILRHGHRCGVLTDAQVIDVAEVQLADALDTLHALHGSA